MSVGAVELGVRIGVALALGALIGLERQWHHRLAGPGTIDKAIKQYVKTVVKALERDGVLAGA